MCGIIGVAGKTESRNRNWLSAAKDLLAHRGPDDSGEWWSEDGAVGFAHRRLSIIDVSKLGRQPMHQAINSLVIVYNGEIYNFKELRYELESFGHVFTSNCDTEVILAAYSQWGYSCLQKFNGMFAFALFDGAQRSVFLARDRVGEKPLYYRNAENTLEFASEVKALPNIGKINFDSLNFYLALGYVPKDRCLFDGVKKLPAGHYATYNIDSGQFDIHRYWQLPINQNHSFADPEELFTETAKLIENAVKRRLLADVPVGILLSGGLDSSLIAAAAARVSEKPIKTFTISLPGSSLNEAHHAQKVADYLGTDHHVLPLENPGLDIFDRLDPLIDEPIADSSILPAWMVFGLARQHVTVALGGGGGDELFGGYKEYITCITNSKITKFIPPRLLAFFCDTAAFLPAGLKWRNRLLSMRGGGLQQVIWGTPYFDIHLRKQVLKSGLPDQLTQGIEAPEMFLLSLFYQGQSPVDCMTRTHFHSMLPDDFLVKIDRASMAHSLEVRAPLLDHHLIEFCFKNVPDHWKVHKNETRRLQRMLAKKWLPPDLDTVRKQGFSIPINEWLRIEGEKGLMKRMESLPDIFNFEAIRGMVRGHLTGRSNGGRIFALIMLSLAIKNMSARALRF